MKISPSRIERLLAGGLPLLVAASVAAGLGACSSDDYRGVGGGLPTDAGQDADSVQVALPPLFPVEAEVIAPVDSLTAEERPVLYIGDRPSGGWRATMLLQFDVGDSAVAAKLPPVWEGDDATLFAISPLSQPEDIAVVRQVRVHELLSPLSADDLAVPDVSILLGPEIGSATWLKTDDSRVELPRDLVRSWVEAGAHNGIAVVHEAPDAPDSVYSNFRGYAGERFSTGLRIDSSARNEPPRIEVEDADSTEAFFDIPVLQDFTHFARDPFGPQDLQIGSYFERRLWLDFDLGPNTIPTDATVNSGTLILQVKVTPTMHVQPYTSGGLFIDQIIRAWEAVRDEAGDVAGMDVHNSDAREVIGASRSFLPQTPPDDDSGLTEIRLDVTEYVQRQVNEIAPDDLPGGAGVTDVGLLLAFTAEQLDLDLGVFYGLDATDDLKPRLEITYTPPANTWQ